MINPQKPVINLIKMFNHFTALICIHVRLMMCVCVCVGAYVSVCVRQRERICQLEHW